MKKNHLFGMFAMAAFAFASCSQDEVVTQSPEVNKAIEFGTYLGRDAVSRGSVHDLASLTGTTQNPGPGFGVFAYYTDEGDYVAATTEATEEVAAAIASPCNFMYNQQVKGTSTTTGEGEEAETTYSWSYSPIKYWPNDPGDKLTFFAYAPYDDADIDNNTNGYDNISFSSHTTTVTPSDESEGESTTTIMAGDPIINFTVNKTVKNQTDLLWSRTDNSNLVKNQLPNQGVTVNSTDRVTFNFAHALARIGFTVRAITDEVSAGTATLLDEHTTIVLKEVRLVDCEVSGNIAPTTGDFYESGTLNLNNAVANVASTPAVARWVTKTGGQYFTLSNDNFIDEADTDNTRGFLIDQTNSATDLNKTDSYVMIIPQDFGNYDDDDQANNTPLYVYVEYDVITADNNVGGTSTVTNHITKPIQINFESGKAYTLNLQLGMTSVKVTADVDPWVDGGSTSVDLPQNTPTPTPPAQEGGTES